MADTTVNASAFNSTGAKGLHNGGIVWLTPSLGGLVYIDGVSDVVGVKTTDGGVTWSAPVAAEAGTAVTLATFADQRVPPGTGSKIHAYWLDSVLTDSRYAVYDISAGTWLAPVTVDAAATGAAASTVCFIAKTRAGGFVTGWANGTASGANRSNDGITWASAANPFEAHTADTVDGVSVNTGATKDSGIIFGDISANEFSVKMYNDTADTWTEQAIATCTIAVTTAPIDVTTRLSDGHSILGFWNETDAVTADFEVWDLTLTTIVAPGRTALPKAVTDSAESGCAGVFVDQTNNDIYASYMRGAAFLTTVQGFYRKLANGGGAFGAEVPYSEAAAGDLRTFFGGSMGPGSQGGRYQPVWFDDNLNDLFVNLVNDVDIAAAVAGAGGAGGQGRQARHRRQRWL